MRLTCPNCSAQYDIPVDMVPPEGRDVQCSNCATVWFQEGRPREEAPEEAAAGGAPASERRPLADEKTLDVLRQERAHEARIRAAERRRSRLVTRVQDADAAPGAPGPNELPRALAAAERARMAQAASVARAREVAEAEEEEPAAPNARAPVPTVADDVSEAVARTLRQAAEETRQPGADPDPDEAAEIRRGSRRDLLPDIEEINSSLRPDERALTLEGDDASLDSAQGRVPQEEDGRSGFRLGFSAVMAVVAVLVAIYVFSAPIASAVPSLADALTGYVAAVDGLRSALEAQVDALAISILPDP